MQLNSVSENVRVDKTCCNNMLMKLSYKCKLLASV